MTIASDRIDKRKRKKAALIEFRRAVLARVKVPGGYKCERCRGFFRHESLIDAHHRLARHKFGSNLIGNGAALCRQCHEGVHAARDDWRDWLVTRNTLEVDQ